MPGLRKAQDVMPNFYMIRILLTIIVLTFGLNTLGQKVTVDTLFVSRKEKFSNSQGENLKYPIIRTGNQNIDKVINRDMKVRFTRYDNQDISLDSAFSNWTEKIIFLDFEVTYLKNGLISLNINSEGCGAYCSNWTDYFTYNYTTGEYLTINRIIDTTGEFRGLVITDKDKQYERKSLELKEILTDDDGDFEKDTYDMVIEYYKDCSSTFQFNSFALHDDYLEIIETCFLPNVIKSMRPLIELKYKYTDIKKYLRIKN